MESYAADNDNNDNVNNETSTVTDKNGMANKIHFRHIMLYYFRKGKRVGETKNKICSVYGDDAIAQRTVGRWFNRFKEGKFNLEDEERSGRPGSADDEKIKALLYENPRFSTRELGLFLGLSRSTVHEHLVKCGFTNRNDYWVPKNPNKTCLNERLEICQELLKRHKTEPFLHRVIVGGEKWILFNEQVKSKKKKSLKRQRQNSDSQNDQQQQQKIQRCKDQKALLSVWWDIKGLIYWELMEYQQQLTPEHYCSQLDIVRYHVQNKRPELLSSLNNNNNYNYIHHHHHHQQQQQQQPISNVIYHHDNVRAHKSEMTREKLLKHFEWEILTHPPFSPDISPSDFHLFRSLKSSFSGKHFHKLEHISEHLQKFFNEQPEKFWHDGLTQLPERWDKVIKRNGAYLK
ncbi:hypothetical protein DERF_012385 [Dermatophagoides farinae]|uniref:Mos1 transposase HTH domain-containing protein n=1 Tax=Dermatophagoides farinae TaxID=6954 RepID=A0A922HS18_DERFA|nr:hypothetical protein DERF_012385 [Dermatophagoides farinae]